MQVFFHSHDPQALPLKDFAEARVRFAMRRLTWLVPRATVQIADVNGPRGGVDKRCRIQLSTDAHGTIVVTSMARDWRAALDSALARSARVLLRAWRRARQPQGGARRAIAFQR
jgi:hypothetical protein